MLNRLLPRVLLSVLVLTALFLPGTKFEQVKAADSQTGQTLIKEAAKYKGTKYKANGTSPSTGFNSSGFVQYVFKKAGNISLPALSSEQFGFGKTVSESNLQPGDVLFFKDTKSDSVSTSGFYIGNGQMIYSSVSEGVTTVNFEKSSYWNSRYKGAKRITENPQLITANPLIKEAISHMGIPYVEGGNTVKGFDCSGFTQYVYKKALGIYLPDAPELQWKVGKPVDLKDIQIGDLVFFQNTHRPGISHVGIYAGENQIINATRIGGANKVTVSYLSSSYLQEKFAGVKRFTDLKMATEQPIVAEAAKLIGTPQKTGGTTPEAGFDTGGFVQYAVKKAVGLDLPRYGKDQMNIGKDVAEKDLQPGDLVFFKSTSIVPSIYAGNGQVILVSNTGGVNVVNYKASFFWDGKYMKAKRLNY